MAERQQQRQRQRQPNILLFVTDQHRLSALGCYGDTPCMTPNIDRLAARGVRFATTYTSCPVCSPARASLITGLYPHTAGVNANVEDMPTPVREIPDGPDLLPRRLQAAGYRCGYMGKWHLGGTGEWFGMKMDMALPSTRGFEGLDFAGHGNGGFRFPVYGDYLRDNGWQLNIERGEVRGGKGPFGVLRDMPVEATVPYFLAEQTIGLIDRFRGGDQPFFLWHNNWGPHDPYYVPQEYLDRYRDVDIPPWPNADWPAFETPGPHHARIHPRAGEFTWDDWAHIIRHYYAFVTLIDEQIGRICAHLEATGLAEDTIIIFTSDHGETLGSHGGLIDKGFHHFEETHRVGLIVSDPRGHGAGGAAPGATVEQWASLVDLYPTILDYAGADYDRERAAGRSLRPVLEGQVDDWRDEVFVVFGGLGAGASMITCRVGDLKYGWNCTCTDELYDLAEDPHETRNQIDDPRYSEALADLRRRMWDFMQRTDYAGDGAFQIARLRQLW